MNEGANGDMSMEQILALLATAQEDEEILRLSALAGGLVTTMVRSSYNGEPALITTEIPWVEIPETKPEQ